MMTIVSKNEIEKRYKAVDPIGARRTENQYKTCLTAAAKLRQLQMATPQSDGAPKQEVHELFFSQLHESSQIRTCRIGAPVRSSGCRTLVVAVRTARPELLHVQDQSNLDEENVPTLPSFLKMHKRTQGGEVLLHCIEAAFAINGCFESSQPKTSTI